MTPNESRDALVGVILKTSEVLDIGGWNEDGAPRPEACALDGGGEGVNYIYGYGAPPGTDHLSDARRVAQFWEEQGMTTRLVEEPSPRVFGTGGAVDGLSFMTEPGDYYIAGSSACVPGDADDLIDQETSG